MEEVVKLVNGRAGMQVEIKVKPDGTRYPGIEQKVVDILRKGNMIDKTTIISFDWPTLQEIKKIEPKLKTGALANAAYFRQVTARQQRPTGQGDRRRLLWARENVPDGGFAR